MSEIDGYTRVTDVLYPFTELGKIDPEVLRIAGDRGTIVHTLCDAEIIGLPAPATASLVRPYCACESQVEGEVLKVEGCLESFRKWAPGKFFVEKPSRFFCDTHKITGECDALYMEEDGLVLVDFKTPHKESKSWSLQGSAYSWLAKQSHYNIKRIEFVRLKRDGKAPQVYRYEENFPLFLKCLEIYRHFEMDIKEPNAFDYI
jgi:hypothetical protein